MKNTVLLSRRHHRRVHEDGYRVFSDAVGQIVFFTPRGMAIAAAPPPKELAPEPIEELIRRNRERGIEPDWRSGMPQYRHDRDIPWKLETAAEANGPEQSEAA